MISTYAWVSGGELPSQRLRSYTFGLAAAIGFLGAVSHTIKETCELKKGKLTVYVQWLCTFTAPYFINPDSLNWG